MAVTGFFGALAAIALGVLVAYVFYGWAHQAFQRVGFTTGEASLVLFGSLLGGLINLPLFKFGAWTVGVNVGGAVVPVVVSLLLLRRMPSLGREALLGVPLVALVTYLVTRPTPEGIVSPFPLWLLPAGAAALVSLAAFWTEEGYAAPLAYVVGTLGTLLGADVFRLDDFLAQTPPGGSGMAAIGGASVFDAVFLTGIVAVGLDAIRFHFQRKDSGDLAIPYPEPAKFTAATPSEVIAAYDPSTDLEVASFPEAARATRGPARGKPVSRVESFEERLRGVRAVPRDG